MLRLDDFVLDRDARQLFRGGIQVHLRQNRRGSGDPASRGRERHRTGRGSTSSSTPPASRAVMVTDNR